MYEDFFAIRLSQLRSKKGVSARDMSLSLGQSESYINKIESKRAFPSMQVFFYICEYLNISPQEFFDFNNKNPELNNLIYSDINQIDNESAQHIHAIIKALKK
ncbi:MAG: helix-turn-helix transcriptional regulator [Clostridia bacterium]